MTPVTKRLVIALSVSAALNVFLIGFGAARLLAPPPPAGEVGPVGAPGKGKPGRMGKRGGPLRALMREQGVDVKADRRALREARRGVSQALRAEPFDVAALSSSLAELRAITGRSQETLHAVLVKAAPEMSPQQRRALARDRHLLGGGKRGKRPPRGPR